MKEQTREPSTDPLVEHLIQELQKQGVNCDTAYNINLRRSNEQHPTSKRRRHTNPAASGYSRNETQPTIEPRNNLGESGGNSSDPAED